jgi:hypothetical protein
MFKIINVTTNNVIDEVPEYDQAVQIIHNLNHIHGIKHHARNWFADMEREVCVDRNGNLIYGTFGIKY